MGVWFRHLTGRIRIKIRAFLLSFPHLRSLPPIQHRELNGGLCLCLMGGALQPTIGWLHATDGVLCNTFVPRDLNPAFAKGGDRIRYSLLL